MSASLVARFSMPVGRSVASLSDAERSRLYQRGRAHDPQVSATVANIVDSVRANGDEALRTLATRFDGVDLQSIEVPRRYWDEALAALDPHVRAALERAAANIRAFHEAQLPHSIEIELQRGVRLGRRAEPLRSVGVYVPGGRAAYPSSVLMGVVPARVAGVAEIVVTSPPGPDGLPSAIVLAACALAGADRVLALGGAGAIAALALGTESVAQVDKIVGPGNAYVTEAKLQLNGMVAIDNPAGPSELLVLADDSADPMLIAHELLAQAEHDPDAAAVLVCTGAAVIEATARAIVDQLEGAPRRAIMEDALARNGALLLAQDETELVRFAEQYAPEHLLLLTREPRQLLEQVRNAGTVFLGPHSSVAFGDYMSGANHVLPTAGRARAYAGLSTLDFLRWFTYQEVSVRAATGLTEPTAALALAEDLPAHAAAARYCATPVYTPRDATPADPDGATGHDATRANMSQATRADTADTPVLRSLYRDIELYDPQRVPCEIDLSDNTNLFGAPPGVERFFAALPGSRITRYPSVFAGELKEAIAAWYGVAPQNVVTGCGSDDVIDSAIRAFCERGDAVAFPDPTFGMVAGFARMNATRPVPVVLTPDLDLDVDALVEARARLTYVCRPNNPTGTLFPATQIEALTDSLPGVLLLDEAYADFATDDFTLRAAASERLVSLRTFSKAFALAGLRIGFAIGPAPLVHEIEKSRGPYKVNNIAEAAALTALREDADWIRGCIAQVLANRERLRKELLARGFRCWPSAGNFLLLAVPSGQSASTLAAGLRRRGVAVRPFPALPRLGDCIRVTIGPWPLMARFLAELFDCNNISSNRPAGVFAT